MQHFAVSSTGHTAGISISLSTENAPKRQKKASILPIAILSNLLNGIKMLKIEFSRIEFCLNTIGYGNTVNYSSVNSLATLPPSSKKLSLFYYRKALGFTQVLPELLSFLSFY